jgi:hypothetical protein
VQVVPLKHTAGTAAHLLVNEPSKQWVKKLVEQGVLLPNRGGIYLGFEEPKLLGSELASNRLMQSAECGTNYK